MAGNPHPFGSQAWRDWNAKEVAQRPTGILKRKPFNFDDYRPKPVQPAPAKD
jgi:hypothetical protein